MLVAGVLLLLFFMILKLMHMKINSLRLALQHEHDELQDERKSTTIIQSQLSATNVQVDYLQAALKKKSHSEEEISIMKAAMSELSAARSDELHGVLIKSSHVRVEGLLGKGGFGVVNLAKYKGQKVAMKQLITINDENVSRFRHECFLMKTLRHPNIVKLVGVCWEDAMFACCLEFVENGTLEDWLRKTNSNSTTGAVSTMDDKYKKLCEKIYLGWGNTDEYDEGIYTAKDKEELAWADIAVEECETECKFERASERHLERARRAPPTKTRFGLWMWAYLFAPT